jgi:CRP/FNR family cyclic AMP-dependent transcriptional regulator
LSQLAKLLRGIPLLADMPESELASLASKAVIRWFKKNTIIVNQGDDSSSLFLILEGKVRVYLDDEEGRQIIINNMGAGNYFGELALLSDQKRSANVMTTEQSKMVIVERNDFLACLESDFSVTKQILLGLVERVQALSSDVKSLALQDVYSRLIRHLKSQAIDERGHLITPKTTHQEIANSIGSSREVVSRILSELKTGGYIGYEGKQIVLLKRLPTGW